MIRACSRGRRVRRAGPGAIFRPRNSGDTAEFGKTRTASDNGSQHIRRNVRRCQEPQFSRDRAADARVHATRTQQRDVEALRLRIAEGHERQATFFKLLDL
jgi:hypothetical protein